MIAALVVGVLLVGAIGQLGGRDPDPSWDSADGRRVQSSFMQDCLDVAHGQREVCECLFARLTALAPFDTPREYVAIDRSGPDRDVATVEAVTRSCAPSQ